MAIENIHYWNNTDTSLTSSTDASQVTKKNQGFDDRLLTLFGLNNSFQGSTMYGGDFFGYDLNSPSQIREASRKAKLMGLEDVLAAQLSSPLPVMSRDSAAQKNAYSGLEAMINLTVQLQIAKAQKVFEDLDVQVVNQCSCPDK